MDLYRDFAVPELKGYLLVEHARNHQTHHLTLASSQRVVAFSQLHKFTLLLASRPVALQGLVDRIQQVLVPEGLGEELDRARLHGPHRHRNIPVTGDENDGNPDARVSQFALKVQATDARKSHVQDQATWPVRMLAAQELLRRRKGLGTQANRLQHALNGRANQLIVIDNEHGGSICEHHSCASVLVGRVKKKLAPRGTLSEAHKRPPCASTME